MIDWFNSKPRGRHHTGPTELDIPDTDDGQQVTAEPIKHFDWRKARPMQSTAGDEPVSAAVAELALHVYHDHRTDPRYVGVYKAAYEGRLSFAEADIEILALAVMDEGGKRKGTE